MAVDPQDIVTIAELLLGWPKASALDPLEQAALITDASYRICGECDYRFGTASYTEIHRPGRSRKVYLRQRPITAIARVAVDFSTVMTVQNTSTSVSRSQVNYTTTGTPEGFPAFTGLTLTSYPNGGGAATVTSLPFATYTSLGTLKTAINAVSGWIATTANTPSGDYSNWACTDLVYDMGSMGSSQLAAGLKAFTRDLQYTSDTEMSRKGQMELYEGLPDGYQFPDRRASYGGPYNTSAGLGGGDPRTGGVFVSYTAGYAPANMPPDLKRAAIGLAKFLRERGLFSALQSETIGKYSYSLATIKHDLPDWILGICDKHTRKEIF